MKWQDPFARTGGQRKCLSDFVSNPWYSSTNDNVRQFNTLDVPTKILTPITITRSSGPTILEPTSHSWRLGRQSYRCGICTTPAADSFSRDTGSASTVHDKGEV